MDTTRGHCIIHICIWPSWKSPMWHKVTNITKYFLFYFDLYWFSILFLGNLRLRNNIISIIVDLRQLRNANRLAMWMKMHKRPWTLEWCAIKQGNVPTLQCSGRIGFLTRTVGTAKTAVSPVPPTAKITLAIVLKPGTFAKPIVCRKQCRLLLVHCKQA